MKELPSFIIIIPARYGSSRFPGKPLANMKGKPMIQRVVERVNKLGARVVVATDNQAIYDCVQAFGGEAVFTSQNHTSGTSRCIEAFEKVGQGEEIMLNLQGDEPFINTDEVCSLIKLFLNEEISIATMSESFPSSTTDEELQDPNKVKLVKNKKGEALYFSRSVIPYIRNCTSNLASCYQYNRHVGIYAFRTNILSDIKTITMSELEKNECLEQLTWLDNGYKIGVLETNSQSIGIDTPQDLEKACRLLD